MIQKFTVSRNDGVYQAWPDVVLTTDGRMICVFSQCDHHIDRNNSRIVLCESADRGRSWTEPAALTEHTSSADFWNCARISRLRDGSLVILVDRVQGKERDNSAQVYMWKSTDGREWQGPIPTPARGIVPDKLLELRDGRWLISVHRYSDINGKLEQNLWYSDDRGGTWSDRVLMARDDRYNPCEVSMLELPDGAIVSFLRENSGLGIDCLKCISEDRGEHFRGVFNMPLPACHRPVSGLLQSGRVLITYRFMQGGKGLFGNWTQNFFAALTDVESAKAEVRKEQRVRIMPLDFDRSPVSDLGYSGWVQFDDGEIYVVNYIVDDAPKAQIRGYSLYESDFILETPSI